MLDTDAIIILLREGLDLQVDAVDVQRLQGDASNRVYYRLSCTTGRTLILMALMQPEDFKTSEEKISQSVEVTELPFLNIQRHLYRHGIPVPEVYHFDAQKGWLLLEDLGDTTLAQRVLDVPEEIRLGYYQDAIDRLLDLQTRASIPDPSCLAFGRAFDTSLWMWEFDHFLEFEVEGRRGLLLPPSLREEIRNDFFDIAETLAGEPRCLTHRDYHSRNLMLQSEASKERIRVIDFQDALMGPSQYDLASLLRDAYILLEEKTIDALIDYYLDRRDRILKCRTDRGRFRELFDLASLQRNLKAAGRFAYIHLIKKNPRYLPFIPQTLRRAGEILTRHTRLTPLRHRLENVIAEWPSP